MPDRIGDIMRKHHKESKGNFILFLIIYFILALPLSARGVDVCRNPLPKHEVRAVWLTTIGGLDWPDSYSQSLLSVKKQQQDLCKILDRLQHGGINTVLFQTRVRATTIYPSSYEPWDGCLSGTPGRSPGYDPLAFAVEECHRRGMEIQAWVVAIPVGKWNGYGCRLLRSKYPSLLKRIGDEGYMRPEMEGTASYLASVCSEIVRNYDVDGIHLDYIRYPETWKRDVSLYTGRKNITRIVEKVSNSVRTVKPWVKMSCSPIGKHDDLTRYRSNGWNARIAVCQDAQVWLRDGLMDELFPMMYFKENNFFPFALDWQENSDGKIVVPGLGIYFLSPKEQNWNIEDIKRELYFLRDIGMGYAFFRSRFFTDNTKGLYDFVAGELSCHQALLPPMTWRSNVIPFAPTVTELTRGDNGDKIEWKGAYDRSDGDYLTYNVYRSTEYPVDVNDVRNLVVMRLRGTDIIIPHKDGEDNYHYAVTAMDRYSNESEPAFTPLPNDGNSTVYAVRDKLLPNDGKTLVIPDLARLTDVQYFIIESMQGNIVMIMAYRSGKVDISQLPYGIYRIRSLNNKGISHRIGWIMKK